MKFVPGGGDLLRLLGIGDGGRVDDGLSELSTEELEMLCALESAKLKIARDVGTGGGALGVLGVAKWLGFL